MSILSTLNSEQKQAVTYQNGPLLIVAGAGTGKTTVITQRIAWLIEQKLAKSDEILALTFTDKAAGEMEERVDKLLPYGYVDLWVSTFHAFGERLLKNHALEIGLPNDFKLLNQTDQWLLVRQNLDKFNLDYYRPLGNPTKFIHALIKLFSRAKDELITPADYLQYAESLELNQDSKTISELKDQETKKESEIANTYHVYQQLLLDNNALDFGDLINYSLDLLKKRPAILEKYRQQFKYILVDEFQDTNYAQYELVKLLALPKNNLTCVADDDQAIYRWRGASLNNVLQFKTDYPKAKQVVLTKNYRSAQNILDLAHKFIQHNNPHRLECQLGQSSDIKASAKQKGIDLQQFKQIDKKLISQSKNQGVIKYCLAKTQEAEAELVVKQIIKLVKDDKEANWNDFAILVRANRQADLFLQYLNQANIPNQFLANRGLYSKSIILDILAYLRLLDNYHEGVALFRIINLPLFNLSPEEINQLLYFSRRKSWSLYETLKSAALVGKLTPLTLKNIARLLGLIDKHTQLARSKTIGQVIYAWLNDSGYLQYLTKKENGNQQDLNYLNQFFKKVQEFERAHDDDQSVNNFLQEMELILESGEEGGLATNFEEGPETVKVLTIHASKGLEFKYVFIVNLVALRFPTTERSEQIALPDKLVKEIVPEGDIHLQEERRLFYVALTRVKQGLFLLGAEDYGGQRKKKPSRFLYETNLTTKEEKIKPVVGSQNNKPVQISSRRKTVIYKVPDKFSFTQLKAFENCPLQYKFAHILHVPTGGRHTFSFGKTMHATLQQFFQLFLDNQQTEQQGLFNKTKSNQITKSQSVKFSPSLDKLLELYNNNWIDDWYESQEHQQEYKKLGRQSLREFYQLHKNNWPKVKYLELAVNFKINNYTIKGKIDRVDETPEGLEIIDYKTGSCPKNDKQIDKEQLLIYQLACQRVLQQNPTKLTYYYLNANKPISFIGQEVALEKITDKINNNIIEINQRAQRDNFPATPGVYICRFCDFKNICEYRQI